MFVLAARLTGWKIDIKNSTEYDQASEDAVVSELIAQREQEEALHAKPRNVWLLNRLHAPKRMRVSASCIRSRKMKRIRSRGADRDDEADAYDEQAQAEATAETPRNRC